jgi:L-fuconolactonase
VEELGELLKAPGRGWPVDFIRPYVQLLLKWFGVRRVIWGSDWPVSMLVSNYRDTLNAMRTAVGKTTTKDEESIFRTNAVDFYSLNDAIDAIASTLETDKVNIQ